MSVDEPSIDYKFVETYFKDKFARPFARRLKYMYFGLEHDKNLFVLSDTEDTDFKYCDPLQTTGLVQIKNSSELEILDRWFVHNKIDRNYPYIFYLNNVMSLLAKIKNDTSNLSTVCENNIVTMSVPDMEDVVIARKIDTHYTLSKLQNFINKYTEVFIKNNCVYFDIQPDLKKDDKFFLINLASQELLNNGLTNTTIEDVKLVLIDGLDLIIPKSLLGKTKKIEDHFFIRLWSDISRDCINFGSYYKDEDILICTSRDNIFIFPKTKKEL